MASCPFRKVLRPYSAVIFENYKLLRFWEDDTLELFDLEKDPFELKNIVNEKPELAQKLLSEMDQYIAQVDALVPRRK